ncbi:MAG: hypothetical protein JSS81_14775 [Acidobacteria bacterium]|nr:hypothetical protein [Acidobacteriota bacterium]
MPRPDHQSPYLPVNCRKCNTLNNSAQSRRCRRCGCDLKPPAPNPVKNGSKFVDIALKFLLVVVVMAIFSVAGIVFVGNLTGNKPLSVSSAPEVTEVNGLPSNSWHKPSIWNWYRDKPTVREVLEKNNQVTSKSLTPRDVQTLSLTGSVSFSAADCLTKSCLEKEAWRRPPTSPDYQTPLQILRPKPTPSNTPIPGVDPADDVSRLRFEKIGSIELYHKEPGKMLRKTLIRPVESPKKADVIEVFDGEKAWKEEIVYENEKIVKSSSEELNGKDLEALKNSAMVLGNDLSENNLTFSRIGKYNGRAQFILQKNDPDKPETIYFDAVTGFLTKIETSEMTCFIYSYAEFNGVNFPSTMYFRTISSEGRTIWMRVDEAVWRVNEPVDDKLFEKKAESE